MRTQILFVALLLVPVTSLSQDPPDASLRLYVLDGGTLTNPDPTWAGVTVEDVKGFTSLPSPAFLVAHPSGTLLWDAGLSRQAKPGKGESRHEWVKPFIGIQLVEVQPG